MTPRIEKLDPPSWWAGHTLNPVRLLLRGEGLADATVKALSPDLQFGPAKSSANGRYLFVDVRVEARAAPGLHAFEVRAAGQRCEAALEILPPTPNKGRWRSFGPDDVFYLIMPDRFCRGKAAAPSASAGLVDRSRARSYHGGNLEGVIERLPYLKELGVTTLWLTPLYLNTQRLHPPNSWSTVPFTDYHGYGPVDYYAMDPHFGDFAALRRLVEAAHAAKLKIVLDQVSNHTGPHHPWVADPPTPTWYHGTLERHVDNSFQTWALADPYAGPESLEPLLEGWFGGILPDLNQNDAEVARYLTQNILWWIGIAGADGMRHDVVSMCPRPYWRQVFEAVKREYPDFRAVGEVNGDAPATVSYFQGGQTGFDGVDTGLDAVFDFPLREAIRAVFNGGAPIERLAATLAQDRLYPDPSLLLTCVGLHDDSRFMGHPQATAEGLMLAFSFLFTTRGIPLVYYGDELAMAGGEDPENRRDFPGGFPGDSRSAFEEGGRTPEENKVFAHVAKLAALRAEHEALRRGRLLTLRAGAHVYAFARLVERSGALVVINNGPGPETFGIGAGSLGLSGSLEDVLGRGRARVERGRLVVEAPARSASIYPFVRSAV